jgi:hypothetical protein
MPASSGDPMPPMQGLPFHSPGLEPGPCLVSRSLPSRSHVGMHPILNDRWLAMIAVADEKISAHAAGGCYT